MAIQSITFDDVEHPVAVVVAQTSAGPITIMASARACNGTLFVIGAHIQSAAGTNRIGVSALRGLAMEIMQELGYGQIHVKGAPRTTGAGPGRKPRFRFSRHADPPPRGEVSADD